MDSGHLLISSPGMKLEMLSRSFVPYSIVMGDSVAGLTLQPWQYGTEVDLYLNQLPMQGCHSR